ncbi:hypothetical protein [Candidatus Nitrosocosmicus hydrocola]|uniref:hypothetical protein n=1 Tax=Candidatus Nitrosocosmicus hydrocola TaxID=1826872 RepID=UPI0011E5A97C|nr:hypothetical protein [Candidatus Nitrosocosmicus hydrocola]
MIYKILLIFILSTTVFIGASLLSASAQILPQNNNPTTTVPSSLAPVKNPYGLRTTDPTNGEKIFINGTNYFDATGKKLALTGFSVANSGNLTGCDVSIVTNNVFPYQPANGTGILGIKDFSKWSYTFGSKYANLHEGSNKITSKLTCEAGNAKAHYSINVTGVKFNGTFPQTPTSLTTVAGQIGNASQPSSISNLQTGAATSTGSNTSTEIIDMPVMSVEIRSPINDEIVNIDNPIAVNGSSDYPQNYDCEVLLADGNSAGVIAPTSANHSNFKKTLAKGVNGSGDYRNWSIVLEPGLTNLKNGSQSLTAKLQCYSPLSSVKFAKVNVEVTSSKPVELVTMDVSIDKAGQGLNQRIIIGANDAITNDPLVETTITGSINDQKFSGSTDADGKYSTSIPTSLLESGDTINVSVTVTKDGYKLKKTSTSFEGAPISTESETIASKPSTNNDETNNNNEADLADRIFDDVQKQLSEQGINIPLPFG